MYQRRGALAQLVERMTVKHRNPFLPTTWGISSVGRVPHWQCGCQRFESAMLHQKNRQTSRVWRFSFCLQPPKNRPASVSPGPILTKVCKFFFGRFAHELGIGYVEFYIQRVVAGYCHPRNKRGSNHLFNGKLCRSIQRAPALQLL